MLESQSLPEVPPSEADICPHLGLQEDQQTCLVYPSHWNLCHHASPASVPSLGHQRKACLSSAHTGCPVFQSGQAAPLPAELRSGHRLSTSERS
jgi:hypothetical protein